MKKSKSLKKVLASSLLLGMAVAPLIVNSTATTVAASKAPEGWSQEVWETMQQGWAETSKEDEKNLGWLQRPNKNTEQEGMENQPSVNNNSSSTAETNNVVSQKQEGVISVNNKDSSSVPLYCFTGSKKEMSNRGLKNLTPWYTDQYKVHQGTKYYRVSTNEWVSEKYVTSFKAINK